MQDKTVEAQSRHAWRQNARGSANGRRSDSSALFRTERTPFKLKSTSLRDASSAFLGRVTVSNSSRTRKLARNGEVGNDDQGSG